MINNKFKRYIIKILPFGLVPMVFSIVYSFLEKGILGDFSFYPSTGNPYTFNFFYPAIISLVVGLGIGFLEVSYLNKVFNKESFLTKLLAKTSIYFGIILLAILIISSLSTAIELKLSPFDNAVQGNISRLFSSFAVWSILLYFTVGLAICLFYSEVSDNIGQYVVLNFLTGKYHRPIEEERIFMFLDMKSSTSIAEKLGHIRYFGLLNEYYADLSDPIVQYGGEIYQYVGDEIVLTWKLRGNVDDKNCIACFFKMQKSLSDKSAKYAAKYEVVPTFKAAIHVGKVTTGEIGKIKKDIVFTGDVLNTTARIQGLCNDYKVQLLLSEYALKKLQLNSSHSSVELGETTLRGKNEKIALYTLL